VLSLVSSLFNRLANKFNWTFWAGVCELCGGVVIKRHCKYICQECGYIRDCSDPVKGIHRW
jgi:hypothetical protein